MISNTTIKTYNNIVATKGSLEDEMIKGFIIKFDKRFNLYFNQYVHIRTNNHGISFTENKNNRKSYNLITKLTQLWACYEMLYNFCLNFDGNNQNRLFTVSTASQKTKCTGFYKKFIHPSSTLNDIGSEFINQMNVYISTKSWNQNTAIKHLSLIKKILQHLHDLNDSVGQTNHSNHLTSWITQIEALKANKEYNFGKSQKLRQDLTINVKFEDFLGLCYVIRNHYLHNGLVISDFDIKHIFFDTLLQCFENLVINLFNKSVEKSSA